MSLHLTATYTSPTPSHPSHTFSHSIAAPPPTSVPAKSAFLADLRARVPALQSDINAFLTARMDDDKRAAGQVDEKESQEEENYGEEVVEA
ncbi:hypothetical protein BO71DRAFT_402943 [Aspergillus ellipticus CBS 707.79]|uniref:EKC/KEOPS complex subunit GON7 n=1 Tax=Aspergillus ellipticus CBS 707.79 TaxID=1448320 RepID=A0A319EEU0_9EURO|nr:hypothetical protein BO71DRAFT_402943 [Aspergillus ellipticus CBS 707.79]